MPEDTVGTIQSRLLNFEVIAYTLTVDGYRFDKAMFPEGGEYYFETNIGFKFEENFILSVNVDVAVYWGKKSTGEKSPLLASIQTITRHLLIEADSYFRDNNYRTFPQMILRALAIDSLAATRGAFVVKNAGTPLSRVVIPSGFEPVMTTELRVREPEPSIKQEPSSEVEVLFDIYEYESEVIPGMPFVPTYGVEAINHKPHPIRVTEHYLETLENGKWERFDHVYFDDKSDHVEWEKAGKLYADNRRKLPKTLKPNSRFLWRIHIIPDKGDRKLRGVVIADKKPYYSEPFDFKSPSRQARAERILRGEED